MTYSTNTDFSRDLLYKIRVFINCACVPGFPIDCYTLFKHRYRTKVAIQLGKGRGKARYNYIMKVQSGCKDYRPSLRLGGLHTNAAFWAVR